MMKREDILALACALPLALSIAVAIWGLLVLNAVAAISGITFAIVFSFAFLTILSVICDKKT